MINTHTLKQQKKFLQREREMGFSNFGRQYKNILNLRIQM